MKPIVLLVEDDAEIRLALAEVLELRGYDVAAATDGADALRQLRSGVHPTAILLDVMMPVMNGWAFRAEQLKDLALADIPVVLLTATGCAEETGRELRTHAALAKPFAVADLLAVLDRIRDGTALRASA